MMMPLDQLEALCTVVGPDADSDQVARLTDWIVEHVPKADWSAAADVALALDLGDVYTDLSMRLGECGM